MSRFLLTASLLVLALQVRAKVLYIGDSHSAGTFGNGLVEKLEEFQGTQVDRYAVGGTQSRDWLNPYVCPPRSPGEEDRCPFKGMSYVNRDQSGDNPPAAFPGFDQILSQTKPKPEAVVIALGTNDAAGGSGCLNSTDATTTMSLGQLRKAVPSLKSVEKLIQKIEDQGKPCVWIGPPNYSDEKGPMIRTACKGKTGSGVSDETARKRYDNYVDNLARIVQNTNCRFVDSRTLDSKPSPDHCYGNGKDGRPLTKCDHLHFNLGSVAREKGRLWGREAAEKIAAILELTPKEKQKKERSTGTP